ncbi:MAG: hypothetical protein IKC89_06925 [Lentisphaeria bacterium]|nr:hypothetical protein [Lentisphaeria bacterium]
MKYLKYSIILLLLLSGVFSFVCEAKAYARMEINASVSDAVLLNVSGSGKLTGKSTSPRQRAVFHFPLASADEWTKGEISFTPDRHGEVRIILSSGGGEKGQAAAFDDFELTGAERLRNPSFEVISGGMFDGWQHDLCNMKTSGEGAAQGKNHIVAAPGKTAEQRIAVFAGKMVTLRFYFRKDTITIPEETAAKVPVKRPDSPDYYRLYTSRVKYLPLRDKGVSPEEITPLMPSVPDLKQVPAVSFAVPENEIHAKTAFLRVPVELLEESGVDRNCHVRFGMPLAKGNFYNLNSFRVKSGDGKAVSAQFSVLSFWEDRSIKSVLVQFHRKMAASSREICFVEGGDKLPPLEPVPPSPLGYTVLPGKIAVRTGKLSADINTERFNLLENITVDGAAIGGFAPGGITLTLENGEKAELSSAPAQVSIEESGRERLTIRAGGKLVSRGNQLFSCCVRLSFYPDSAKVDMEIRLINTNLKSEFNDFVSIDTAFVPASLPAELKMDNYVARRIFQHHDRKLQYDGKYNRDRLSGGGSVTLRSGKKFTFNLFKAALRYPKAFSISGKAVKFELLPAQGDADFGKDLPCYLSFPFCEGFYRLKWGMGFREHLSLDFSGETAPAALEADIMVPVIDKNYVAATGVYPGVVAGSRAFDRWNDAALAAFREHIRLKEKQREYGFLNYGDWFGERVRNWGNNEYDLARGLFLLFLRTGERELFRRAKLAAIHQADTDIIHAYPDGAFVGANAQHGVGHTGISYQRVNPAGWSLLLDKSFLGSNGHTWAEGMTTSWMLTGDAATMESALLLGEHLKRYISPLFYRLSTHERSAGWSARALLGLYRATGDKSYLSAAEKIIGCILAEQKNDLGGAWPHKLPRGHAGGHTNTYGNCPYLVSILIDVLYQYYKLTGDAKVKTAIINAAKWQLSAFDPILIGWPYGVSFDGRPYNNTNSGSNMMIGAGLAAGARLGADREMYRIAGIVAASGILNGCGSNGKSLAMYLAFTGTFIDELDRFARENPKAEPFSFSPGKVEHFLRSRKLSPEQLKFRSGEFRVRGGRKKEFRIRLKAQEAVIDIRRRPCGARLNGAKHFSGKLLASDGAVVMEFSGKSSEAKSWRIPLKADSSAPEFHLLLNDDFMGEWHVDGGKSAEVGSVVLPGYSFLSSQHSQSSFRFTVPENLREFSVRALPLHGTYARVTILDDRDDIVGEFISRQTKAVSPWDSTSAEKKGIVIPVKKSKYFRIITFGSGDISLDLPGILYL